MRKKSWVTDTVLPGVLVGSLFESTYIKKFLQNGKAMEAVALKVVGACSSLLKSKGVDRTTKGMPVWWYYGAESLEQRFPVSAVVPGPTSAIK